jgi:hypothetical protein
LKTGESLPAMQALPLSQSIRHIQIGRTKTSKLANKRIKALLTMCAGTAIQYNPEMKQYYENRIQKGKNNMSTLNIIRNKLLSRIFAVIDRGIRHMWIFISTQPENNQKIVLFHLLKP